VLAAPCDVVGDGPLDVELRPEAGVLGEAGDVEVGVLAGTVASIARANSPLVAGRPLDTL
jgi:hypothetical protein